MSPRPVAFRWDAAQKIMRMLPRFEERARAQFKDGETYVLEVRIQRSSKHHAFFFSAVAEAWNNLSDEARERYPTPDHLRKWAMVRCGFYHEQNVVFDTESAAIKAAILARKLDDYAVIVQRGNVVRILSAHSQSERAADAQQFKQQADAVLTILANEIGVSRKDLEREGRLRHD